MGSRSSISSRVTRWTSSAVTFDGSTCVSEKNRDLRVGIPDGLILTSLQTLIGKAVVTANHFGRAERSQGAKDPRENVPSTKRSDPHGSHKSARDQ